MLLLTFNDVLVFLIANFEHISHLFSIVHFELVNVNWVVNSNWIWLSYLNLTYHFSENFWFSDVSSGL